MRLFRSLFAIAATVVFSGVIHANKTYDSSVLPPGARIVAGDLSKNEFFILAGNDDPQMKTAVKQTANQPVPKLENKHIVPEIKTALNEVIRPPVKKPVISHPVVATAQKAESTTPAAPRKPVIKKLPQLPPPFKASRALHKMAEVHKVKSKAPVVAVVSHKKKIVVNKPVRPIVALHKTVRVHQVVQHKSKLNRNIKKITGRAFVPEIKEYSQIMDKAVHKKIYKHSIAVNKSKPRLADRKSMPRKSIALRRVHNSARKLS